ncbi:MAG: hypothetical protein M1828_005144 [Chrysothrix sp. TS-e1954]|nr:MAG: hypothetical protein M1828_005144 [Chrysothrix sp. TS-e1954]
MAAVGAELHVTGLRSYDQQANGDRCSESWVFGQPAMTGTPVAYLDERMGLDDNEVGCGVEVELDDTSAVPGMPARSETRMEQKFESMVVDADAPMNDCEHPLDVLWGTLRAGGSAETEAEAEAMDNDVLQCSHVVEEQGAEQVPQIE